MGAVGGGRGGGAAGAQRAVGVAESGRRAWRGRAWRERSVTVEVVALEAEVVVAGAKGGEVARVSAAASTKAMHEMELQRRAASAAHPFPLSFSSNSLPFPEVQRRWSGQLYVHEAGGEGGSVGGGPVSLVVGDEDAVVEALARAQPILVKLGLTMKAKWPHSWKSTPAVQLPMSLSYKCSLSPQHRTASEALAFQPFLQM
ncbi:hypothetical protein [Oryza sativa Japonica Group]|uniref:Uncharacterized protein n=1 Tax=Oryza sativa subsp. japonica TaxID=39947 RepID=Q5ZAT1_ORYSJ|nr:hypothetical protein [Oryza sativa Japonica Group]